MQRFAVLLLAIGVVAAAGQARSAGLRTPVSPCGSVSVPATWSPGGTQLAWYGYRWPLPPLHHRSASITVLRAICVSDAAGRHLQPIRSTVCSEHCSGVLSDPPGQLAWAGPRLLYGNDLGIYAISPGRRPELVARKAAPEPFSADAGGDRVAAGGSSSCTECTGPVKILSVPSGAVVGVVGGTKVDNIQPSLSPDGTQVVFARLAPGSRELGIWTAAADGSHLQRLERSGIAPLWSPAGDRIAYLSPSGTLRVVAPQGGASTTLLRRSPGAVSVFGWSPDGRRIAVSDAGRLAVVDVATRKARALLKLQLPYDPSSVAWSPDSRQLLVVWRPPTGSDCPSGLWRVPIDGAAPRLIHGC
jgi:hypothetical protein